MSTVDSVRYALVATVLLVVGGCSSSGTSWNAGDADGLAAPAPEADSNPAHPLELGSKPGPRVDRGPKPAPDTRPGPMPGGPIGPKGGTVSLLHFGITGDTRPATCEDTANYPTAVIEGIATQLQQRQAQFALDLGDHMYVCNQSLSIAKAQMALYMKATGSLQTIWFMAMGNHECYGGGGICLAGSQNANYVAFMDALAPTSSLPYYSFDIQTSKGLATFVIVADNAWDQTQASWLEQTLAQADQKATYTIVARHHPTGDSTLSTNPINLQIIRSHKFALLLTAHEHIYKHPTNDNGRNIVIGTGGAPLIVGGTFYGYAMVDQQANGQLQVTVFDLTSASPVDSWSVGPN